MEQLEKCTDPLDMANQMQNQANELARELRQIAERRRVRAFIRALDADEGDGQHCLECDISIPWLRLANYNLHCTGCAQIIENQNKRMKK